jgi:hypothetical protein
MSEDRFIFNTVGYQNSANTVANYVENFNTATNAATTGLSFRFQTDAARMQNLIGSRGQSRLSGYYDYLVANFYALTVLTPTVPAIGGPGGTGWGRQIASNVPLSIVSLNDTSIQKITGSSDYVGVVISGYIYSPKADTITFQATSDDGSAVYFNGGLVLDNWGYHGATTVTSAAVPLYAGFNPIRIVYFEGPVTGSFEFSYKIGSGPFTQATKCVCFHNYANL